MSNSSNEPTEDTRMSLTSADVFDHRLAVLRDLFPEAFAEGRLDHQRLRVALGQPVDEGRERYGLTWAGKAEAMRAIQVPSIGTLLPVPDDSVDFASSENVFIEGDNLEVLKLLQKSYYGQVKVIYIDPPYNTGNEFIYPDNFREGLQDYLRYSGQVDAEGLKLSTNTEANGRFHSKWLSMMWPRLFIARNLLREDGVIAVSIDDHEVHNLRHLLDEIFGQENFVCTFAWQRKDTPANDAQGMSVAHEYVVVYARSEEHFGRNLLPRTEEQLANYKNPDNDPRGPWTRGSLIRREGDYDYEVTRPDGTKMGPPRGSSWRVPPATMQRLRDEKCLWWGKDGTGELPFAKVFLTEVQQGVVPTTWWDYEFAGSTRNAKADLKALFADGAPFDTPKPVKLVQKLLEVACGQDDLILDFFAGSGTTGEAVMRLNNRDGGSRRFILVQLPEATDREDSKTISAICRERLRRAGRLVAEGKNGQRELAAEGSRVDLGFRAFRLTSSNFKIWDGDVAPRDPEKLIKQIRLFADNLIPERPQDAILYELILKAGLPLTAEIQTSELHGAKVHSVAGGLLLVCLQDPISREVLRAMTELKPQRVLCLDHAFRGNDKDKVNALLEMRSHGIEFRTV